MNEWINPDLFCSYKYLSEMTMTNSALSSPIPGKFISIYPDNDGFTSVWNIQHFLSSLSMHKTIISVGCQLRYERVEFRAFWGLLPMLGKSSSVWVSIGVECHLSEALNTFILLDH